jgi:hypothetical protein
MEEMVVEKKIKALFSKKEKEIEMNVKSKDESK